MAKDPDAEAEAEAQAQAQAQAEKGVGSTNPDETQMTEDTTQQ